MGSHLTTNPPTNDSREPWMVEDAHLFLQIHNSIGIEVLGLINHCEYFKELMDYLDFQYFGKANISCVFDVCKTYKELVMFYLLV